jgi:hypothetical protein
MTGVERKRRRITQEEEEAFTTLWIYLEHRLSFFFFLFDWGFGSPPGILARQAFVVFGKSKHAKELWEFMFSPQQLYSPATRRDESTLVLYSRSLFQRK